MSPYFPNEEERLAAVKRYEILDTPPDGAFDRVVALAARFFNVPIAIISIIDHDRIWFKSRYGLEVEQIERGLGLCASTILQDNVYNIIDASIDPRTLANPLVAGEFGLRFYAAAPLRTSDGFNLGTLCVIDFNPRSISEAEKATLLDLAAIVIDELELRLSARKTIELERALRTHVLQKEQAEQIAKTDALTGLKNRRAFDEDIEAYVFQASQSGADTVVALIDIDGFKSVNDILGHQQGDILLKTFAKAIQRHFREDTTYRFGGDEFALLIPFKDCRSLNLIQKSIQRRMDRVIVEIHANGFKQVSASTGIATAAEADYSSQEAIRLADNRMYIEKRIVKK